MGMGKGQREHLPKANADLEKGLGNARPFDQSMDEGALLPSCPLIPSNLSVPISQSAARDHHHIWRGNRNADRIDTVYLHYHDDDLKLKSCPIYGKSYTQPNKGEDGK